MQRTTASPSVKESQRQTIARQVEEFLRSGGKVQEFQSRLKTEIKPVGKVWHSESLI